MSSSPQLLPGNKQHSNTFITNAGDFDHTYYPGFSPDVYFYLHCNNITSFMGINMEIFNIL